MRCSPPEPRVGDSVTCRAQLSGGEPDDDGWLWIGGSSSGTAPTFTTTFNTEGRQVVWLSVTNSAGSDTDSANVDVQPPPDVEPEILSINCPSSVGVNDSVTCTANVTGTEPLIYSWSGGDSSGGDHRYRTSFSSSGTKTVRLTVRNSAGSDSGRANVVVEPNGPTCIEPSSLHATLDLAKANGDPHSLAVAQVCEGDNLTFSARSSNTAVATISTPSGSRGEVVFRAVGRGEAQITLTATDRAGRPASVTFTVTVIGAGVDPPDITISCSPSSIDEGESVTCSVTRNRGGAIDTYDWSASGGRPSSGSSSTYSPSFSSEGSYTVRLTARNAGGSGSDSTTVRVNPVGPERPRPSISCTARVMQGGSASCRVARNRGGPIDRWLWSGGDSSGSRSTYSPSWSSYGRKTVSLTASNAGGSGSNSLPVDVVADPEGWTYARCGSDTIRVYWFNSTNLTKHWLNMTWDEVGRRVRGWGEHLIGHLNQDKCNSWPDGRVITYDTWDG